jgi:hypothetical protein
MLRAESPVAKVDAVTVSFSQELKINQIHLHKSRVGFTRADTQHGELRELKQQLIS